MTNFQFLQKYQQLQFKVVFDKIDDLNFANIGYCEIYKSTFWNFALVDKTLNKDQLKKIEKEMVLKQRTPAVYFEHRQDLQVLISFLKDSGYELDYEDSWMFYSGSEIDTSRFDQIKRVENENDLKIYLNTFDASNQPGDPQNPYGSLGDYLKTAERAWFKYQGADRLEYFIVFKEDKPVAVSTLNNYEGIGYISNVGSLKELRGEGFGKLATLYCVHKSQKNGNKIHCLATEEGTYPNEFYKRIGFQTKFTAVGYKK